ncbi:hypothetical protein ANN_16613 [Periplaneta americana]|uniref:DUF4817 domain-containing protein n=1 Tax=Periplaneta americana TaxID=6978 RepID=A0ABQ8SS82_PERAM|nr:hypothetical protein ANN_16613 [Periplaneta americana]
MRMHDKHANEWSNIKRVCWRYGAGRSRRWSTFFSDDKTNAQKASWYISINECNTLPSVMAELVVFLAARSNEQIEKLCYCFKIKELFEAIGVPHIAEDWRLFIDSSTRSLKAVLLHNGNMYPSIPVGYSTHLKEDYENVRFLLEKINYTSYKWDICGDFKMLGFILGLQGGFTKYSCFLCLLDSRATDQHYTQKTWPQREHLIPGKHNVIHDALVPREKILRPPLHIKLGLVKQFVKALEPNSVAYLHIRKMFPHLSDAKVKGGIFIGLQIRLMLSSEELEQKMTDIERNAWKAFRAVVTGFLGNKKSDNYEEIVASLLEHYRSLGCRMSIKLHYLHSHLEFFRPNLGDISEEHGERFHQDIETMEKRYQGRRDAAIMGDYIWSLVRSTSDPHKRKYTSDNAGEMSPGSSTESYRAFARIGLRENPGKNPNQVTCPDRDSNPGYLVSPPDALTVTPQVWTCDRSNDKEPFLLNILFLLTRRRFEVTVENVFARAYVNLADMVMCYGEARGNGRRALHMYQQQFQNRNHPHHTMFARLYQRLRDDGSLLPRRIAGRPRRHPFSIDDYTELKGKGDNAGEMSPGSSTESYPAFARIGLRENPRKNLNQVTCPDRDSNPGHLVSQPDALTVTPQVVDFLVSLVRTNENLDDKMATTNQQRAQCVLWYAKFESVKRVQREFRREYGVRNVPKYDSIMLWCRIFVERGSVLKKTCRRWQAKPSTRSSYLLAWSPNFPDLTPPDFFVWGFVKDIVYSQKLRNIDDPRVKITEAFQQITPLMLQRTWIELHHRYELCRVRNGSHVEL